MATTNTNSTDDSTNGTTTNVQEEEEDDGNDFRFCRAQSEFSLEFEPPPFRVNFAVENVHTLAPRFGHARDINLLIIQEGGGGGGNNMTPSSSSSNKADQQQDYLTGLLASSFAIFCLFVVWTTMLWTFKCLGPTKVGFLSARRTLPVKPDKPEAVSRQERIRKKHPFQHNGEASGYYGNGSTSAKKGGTPGAGTITTKNILKPVVGVAKAPITVVSKARQKKREIERRNQFSRMNSGIGDDDIMDEDIAGEEQEQEEQEQEQAAIEEEVENDDSKEQARPRASSEVLSDTDRKIIRQYEEDWKAYEQQIYRGQDRIRRIRLGAGFCAICILISALMFTIMTQDSFTTSLEMFDSGLQQVNTNIDQALTISANYAERQANARDSTRKFLLQINEICPNSAEQLCTNIENETATTLDERGCDFSTVPYGNELATLFNVFDTTLRTVLDGAADIEEDLVTLQEILEKADLYYPKHGVWAFWTAVGCSLALGVVALVLSGGMVYIEMGQGQQANGRERKLPPKFAWCRSWLLVPLLLLLVCLSWIFSMTFIMMGIGSSDLCYNSPDVPVLNLLETIEDEFGSSSLMYFFLRYYVSGCPAVEAPRELELAIVGIKDAVLPVMGTLVDAIQAQGEENLAEICGTGVAPVLAIVEALGEQLCVLGLTMADLRTLLQCENWYPLYRYTMHEAICFHATQGFTWAASTQLVIVILSLVLLTLRVSFYELEETMLESDDDDADDDANEATPRGCFACLCPAKAPKKDEHIGEITVTQPKEGVSSRSGGQSWFSCFGSNKRAPKDAHIGEIKVNRQAAAAATATPTPPPPPPGSMRKTSMKTQTTSTATPSKVNSTMANSSGSFSSGDIEEESLKG